MADLRVDYQLLSSIHATLNGLTWEFETIEDQASAYFFSKLDDRQTQPARAGWITGWPCPAAQIAGWRSRSRPSAQEIPMTRSPYS
jgi:hypothetical protein